MIMITTKLNDKPELSPYFPDGTLCHQDDSGSKYYCQVIVVIVIVIMIIMIMIIIIYSPVQIWMTLTDTLQTPPPRYSRDERPFKIF